VSEQPGRSNHGCPHAYRAAALAERHAARFFIFAGILAGVFAISTVVEVLARYAEQRLGVVWCEWLTRRFIVRYLGRIQRFIATKPEVPQQA
jgi:ABC-type uncharacterized transport system fused permease/ATPase subunit